MHGQLEHMHACRAVGRPASSTHSPLGLRVPCCPPPPRPGSPLPLPTRAWPLPLSALLVQQEEEEEGGERSELRAAKRRRMLSQSEVLEQAYLRMRAR